MWLLTMGSPNEWSQEDPTLFHIAIGYFIHRIPYYSRFSSLHLVTLSLAATSSNDSPSCVSLFCFTPRFQKLRKPLCTALPLAYISILILFVYCTTSSLPPAILVRLANCSSAIHVSLTLFAAYYLPCTLHKVVKLWTLRPDLDICHCILTVVRACDNFHWCM